jgi:hypothetical protein
LTEADAISGANVPSGRSPASLAWLCSVEPTGAAATMTAAEAKKFFSG